MKKTSLLKKIIIVIISLLLLTGIGSWLYIQDYYHSKVAVTDFVNKKSDINVSEDSTGIWLTSPSSDKLFIFYPGAKVEYTAYLELMYQIAQQDINVVIVKMPGNLAIFGKNSAQTIIQNTNYAQYYIGGHSLGGAMAAQFTAEHPNDITGLVLLAAYSVKDLSNTSVRVLDIYGSQDGVLNLTKHTDNQHFLPTTTQTNIIEGGNHAGFAQYGQQKGDNTATISTTQQIDETAALITHFINQ